MTWLLPSWAKLALRNTPYVLLAIFFALWWHRGDVIAREDAAFTAFVKDVEATTARVKAMGLERIIRTQKGQKDAAERSLKKAQADRAALDARYDGLRARFNQDRTKPVAVPSPSTDEGRFIVCPTDRGFWCIRPEVGLAILHAGDVAVQRVEDLLDFDAEQAGVTIDIPPEPAQ